MKTALTVTALIAGVLTVTSSASASNPVILVTSTADSGAGTLRTAINTANNTPGADTINFAIPGCAPCTITLASALPTIMFQPITIDGFTQAPSLGQPAIIIDGTSFRSGPNAEILEFVLTDNSTVRGLALVGGPVGAFIFANNFVFERNWVGTADGVTAYGNLRHGVYIMPGGGNSLQNITLRENVISGNGAGVSVTSFNGVDTVKNLVVSDNRIGTTASGSAPLPNGTGVGIDAVPLGATISGNEIRYNTGYGVSIGSPSTSWTKTSGIVLSRNLMDGNTLGGIRIFSGNNGGQAAPTFATSTTTDISGSVAGAGPGVKVEVFEATCGAGGAQGRTFLGEVVTGTDGSFALDLPNPPSPGTKLTATATGTTGTSTFSSCATVTAPAASPVGVDDAYEVASNQQLTIAAPGVLGNDTDANGDPLSATLLSQSANGSVVLNSDGGVVYTPPPDFGGLFIFTYRVSDGSLTSGPVTAMIDVRPAPPAVQGVSGSLDDEGRAVVSFTPISDPFYGSIEYRASCAAAGGATATATSPLSPIVVSGLTLGPTYRCTVTATNIGGTSPDSALTDPLPTADPPEPPVDVTGLRSAAPTAVLSFAAGPDGGAPITAYEAVCTSPGGVEAEGTSATSPITVSGLASAATYTCRIAARSAAGLSSPSTAVTLEPPTESTVEGASGQMIRFTTSDGAIIEDLQRITELPSVLPAGTSLVDGLFGFRVSNVTPGGSVDVTFEFPSGSAPNIDGYLKHVDGQWTELPSALVDLSVSDQVTITLVDGGPFDDDGVENGTIVDPGAPVVVDSVPSPPTITGITFDDDHRAQVSYTPGSDGGQPFMNHFVNCKGPDSYSGGGAVGLINPLPVIFQIDTPEAPATVMECTMGSINSVGESPRSAVFTVTTPSTPGRPTSVTASTHAAGNIRVYFARPWYPVRNGVGAGVTYVATCTSTDGSVTVRGERNDNPIDIEGVPGGLSYTCVIASKNAFGTGPSSPTTPPLALGQTRPAAPAKPTVTPGSSAVTVSWTPPADGGSPITGYTVTATPGGATCSPVSVSSTECTVTGLEPGVSYTFSVTATSVRGTSSASPASDPVSLGTLPGAPMVNSAASVVVDADRSALVVFTPPTSDGGAPVIDYTATCTSSNSGVTRTADGSSSPVKVGGLSPAKSYTCRVAARNAIGVGPLSVATRVFTMPTQPGRPTVVVATPSGSRQVSVAYTAPVFAGSAPISSYTLRCESSDGGATPANVVGSANPLVMNSLTAGKTYTCRVQARNSTGVGPWSDPLNTFVATGLPGTPAAVEAVAAGSTKATVTVQPPADNTTFPATGYSTTCVSPDGGVTRTVTAAASPISVTGLTAAKTYVCSTRSTNGAGSSTAMAGTAFTLPLPPAPQEVRVTTTGTTASVAFTAGAANGSDAVTTNTATCTSSTGGVSRSASLATSPITVTALTAGATYTCTVTAKAGSLSGVASEPSPEFVVASTPAAPTTVGITPGGDTAAVVRFTAPADGGSPITSYSVTCSSSVSGVTTRTASGPASPLVVTGLVAGTTYACAVTARNIVGVGAASTQPITTLSAPSAPSAVDIELAGNTSPVAIVTFTPAAAGPGSQAIAWHQVTCTPVGGGTTRTARVVAGPAIVTGLAAKTTYSCVVAAGTAGSVLGSPSTAVSVTTN